MLLTLREIKSKTEKFFSEKGIPNGKLDTDLILSHALKLKRLDLYLDLDRPIYEKELNNDLNCIIRLFYYLHTLHWYCSNEWMLLVN